MAGDFRLGGNDHGYYGYYDYEVVAGGGAHLWHGCYRYKHRKEEGFLFVVMSGGRHFFISLASCYDALKYRCVFLWPFVLRGSLSPS